MHVSHKYGTAAYRRPLVTAHLEDHVLFDCAKYWPYVAVRGWAGFGQFMDLLKHFFPYKSYAHFDYLVRRPIFLPTSNKNKMTILPPS